MIFLTLFVEFLKIGLFTFGGGYAMIPLIRETVLSHGWMNSSEFIDMIGVSEVTPGPIAINMATYIGSTQGSIALGGFGSFLGALVATLGVILPAFIIMLLISIVLKRINKNKYVQGALKGIGSVAIALIFSSALLLLGDVLFPYTVTNSQVVFSISKEPIFIFLIICLSYFTVKFVSHKKISPLTVILFSAILGVVVGYLS